MEAGRGETGGRQAAWSIRRAAPSPGRGGPDRRRLLLGGAVAAGGAASAIGADQLSRGGPDGSAATAAPDGAAAHGSRTEAFFGAHQAGIATVPQAHATFLALDLREKADRDAIRRMLRILTDDAARLTQAEAALADSEPELAAVPARLTITFGFGPRLVTRAAGEAAVPSWLGPLPAFGIDRLEPAWSDGDLLLQIAADDPVAVAHATRMLAKDTRSFAGVRWRQSGFRRARGSEPAGTTMRNLFGQVDGTVNAAPGTADFDQVVWHAAPSGSSATAWLTGGTSMVVRRIRMDLDRWDALDRSGREQVVGRFLTNGAPLTGTRERDEPDFAATTAIGFPMIPEFSHLRRARSDNEGERIYRRSYNYDGAPTGGAVSDSGLVFASYQADVTAQFLPIQRRLAELDLLNEWTTPIGSAVFAIPPGTREGGFVGETLLA
ncbi:Dyp-type peroxidase [Frankia sp. KB5]|uniref:Dyp-type peroxidase n=1 Tax=Frankia sp. KB5 TaxID=683318 RepID=UPI000A0F7BEC|nr:Dyp-type peroxidase [Frankia sp. KB5]ORT53452.1 peroxidase [Frankia sp. KB5]